MGLEEGWGQISVGLWVRVGLGCDADGFCVQCREALTTRQKLIAQDYKVSYSLARSCKSDLRKYRCNTENSMPRAREARLSYLLLCLESAVHRGNSSCCWGGQLHLCHTGGGSASTLGSGLTLTRGGPALQSQAASPARC